MAFSSSFFTPTLDQDAAAAAPAPGNSNNSSSQPHEHRAPGPQTDGMEEGNQTPSQVSTGRQPAEQTPSSPSNMPTSASDGLNGISGTNGQEAGDAANSAAPKMAPSKKKKGTAAAVKAPPKRARSGTGAVSGTNTTKKAKKGGSKKAKTDATSASPKPDTGDAGDDGGDSSESDNGPYCLCRGPDDHRFMIACDRCEDWFHGECIGMDKHTGENLVQKYICPNCTDGGRYATRYKKMCSLAACKNPARIYDVARPSIFCSPDHCQAWWEQLIAALPRTKSAAGADHLTQEEFTGLLDAPPPPAATKPDPSSSSSTSTTLPTTPWHLGKPPFSTPSTFWDQPASAQALTPEEQTLLTTSATARYQLGEEIVLCKKMLQLIDMALAQREAAVAAGKGTAKDLCGYDLRLDTVSATHPFALFLASPQGDAIFRAGRLDALPTSTATTTKEVPAASGGDAADFTNMCPKKKCKPHNGWSAILTKSVRHDMKELAAQAKEMVDAEQRVRDGAAGRFGRRIKERNGVVVFGEEKGEGEAMEV